MGILQAAGQGIILHKTSEGRAALRALREQFPEVDTIDTRQYPQHRAGTALVFEDEHLAALKLPPTQLFVDQMAIMVLRQYGLRSPWDWVYTSESEGVASGMPDWLQEDAVPGDTGGFPRQFSFPGSSGVPARPRLSVRVLETQQFAKLRRERRVATLAARRAGDVAALRYWPELAGGDIERFLGDCWALVEFVETSREGGSARRWVESTYPAARWHISVHDGYTDQLRTLLTAHYRKGSPQSLAPLRRRAGEYVAALLVGAGRGTVSVDHFEAWKAARLTS